MKIKVAIIGAGSIGFTCTLLQDILTVPELEDTTFGFTDINEKNLDMITQLAERYIKANKKQPGLSLARTGGRPWKVPAM